MKVYRVSWVKVTEEKIEEGHWEVLAEPKEEYFLNISAAMQFEIHLLGGNHSAEMILENDGRRLPVNQKIRLHYIDLDGLFWTSTYAVEIPAVQENVDA